MAILVDYKILLKESILELKAIIFSQGVDRLVTGLDLVKEREINIDYNQKQDLSCKFLKKSESIDVIEKVTAQTEIRKTSNSSKNKEKRIRDLTAKNQLKALLLKKKIDDNGTLTRSKFFGTDLSCLVDDDQSIPIVLNKLLMAVEVRALFVEGIYRKSGALPMVRNVRKTIETASQEDLNFEDVPVHVIATLIKSFFRELPEPLITYRLYENFLSVSEVFDPGERTRLLNFMVRLLPNPNRCVLDRLMNHLAKVAYQEQANRMGESNLAILFAPCIMRRKQVVLGQEPLMDVQKQAVCVQLMIEEKLNQFNSITL